MGSDGAAELHHGPVLQPKAHLQPRPLAGAQEAPRSTAEAVASHTEGRLALFVRRHSLDPGYLCEHAGEVLRGRKFQQFSLGSVAGGVGFFNFLPSKFVSWQRVKFAYSQ